ncbi:MAG: GNAT family N-acetyltransferase [Firmicutes bacterium]|nr:GNAT family N-acetyltransferase [Bacillota bacterium]
MELRKAKQSDFVTVMEIIEAARAIMKGMGLVQWQDGHPNAAAVSRDICDGNFYVAVEGDEILGCAALLFDAEPTYNYIENGAWQSDRPYATVHKVATKAVVKRSGIASFIMESFERLCVENGVYWLRVDTHEDNTPMRNLIKKQGFVYSGKVYVVNNSPRLAYEKKLNGEWKN